MAHAVRKVWLEPEEHESLTPQLTPRRQSAAQPAFWRLPVVGGSLVLILLAGVVCFTYGIARLARQDISRQQLQRELVGLQRECVALRLESQRLHTQPRMQSVATAEGLELPTADRVHYVRVTDPVSPAVLAHTPTTNERWAARSGQQLVASLDQALQHLGRVPGEKTAYAQQ